MRKIDFLVALTFVALLIVPSFQTTACAQNNNVIINRFITALNNEFSANKDVMTVKSVTRNANVVTIDAYAIKDNVSAELLYEVLDATRKYVVENPTSIPDDYKEVQDALVTAGISFHLSIKEADNSKKYVVKYTAKEFVGMYVLDDAVSNPEMMVELFEYIPFEKLILIVNESAGTETSLFQCENGFLYIVVPMEANDYVGFKQMYDFDSIQLASMMKKSIFENLDESSELFIDLAHKNNYKLAMKVVCQGYEPLRISLE